MSCVIVAAGVVSPCGLSLAETAAGTRARLSAQREIEIRDLAMDPYVVCGVNDDGIPELAEALNPRSVQTRVSRMLRIAHVAMAEVLADFPPDAAPLPLLLGLPEQHTLSEIVPGEFLRQLVRQTEAPIDLATSIAVSRGRAGPLLAIRQAVTRLQTGQAGFVLVGGVDSLLDICVLNNLDLEQRIRNGRNPDGLIAGEGAAFVLLALAETAGRYQLPAMATVAGYGAGAEPGHLYAQEPYLGEGLASAFAELFASAADVPPVQSVYAGFNGERYWGKEFGVARLRNAGRFAEPLQMEHPAECFGDLGAAHGLTMAALAAHGIANGYRRAPSLVYASSDHADRAALLLTSHQ